MASAEQHAGDRIVGLTGVAVYGMDERASHSDTWVTGDKVDELKLEIPTARHGHTSQGSADRHERALVLRRYHM